MQVRNSIRSVMIAGAAALAMAGVVIVPTAMLTGCNASNEAQVKQTATTLTQTLTSAVSNVAQLEGNPTLAAQLTKDGNAAVVAINNWQNGSPADDVIEALGIVQDDLNLIPGTSQYAPLIDIAIGTIQTILSLIPQSAVTPVAGAKMAARRSNMRTVHLTQAAPHDTTSFIQQWNATVKAHPNLAPATIK